MLHQHGYFATAFPRGEVDEETQLLFGAWLHEKSSPWYRFTKQNAWNLQQTCEAGFYFPNMMAIAVKNRDEWISFTQISRICVEYPGAVATWRALCELGVEPVLALLVSYGSTRWNDKLVISNNLIGSGHCPFWKLDRECLEAMRSGTCVLGVSNQTGYLTQRVDHGFWNGLPPPSGRATGITQSSITTHTVQEIATWLKATYM